MFLSPTFAIGYFPKSPSTKTSEMITKKPKPNGIKRLTVIHCSLARPLGTFQEVAHSSTVRKENYMVSKGSLLKICLLTNTACLKTLC